MPVIKRPRKPHQDTHWGTAIRLPGFRVRTPIQAAESAVLSHEEQTLNRHQPAEQDERRRSSKSLSDERFAPGS